MAEGLVPGHIARALVRIRTEVRNCDRECSGAVHEDGTYTLAYGSLARARVDSLGACLWHTHPKGPLLFSIPDWICFLYSRADLAALIAGDRIMAFRKGPRHLRLPGRLDEIARQFKGHPALFRLGLVQAVEAEFAVDFSRDRESDLAGLLQVETEILG